MLSIKAPVMLFAICLLATSTFAAYHTCCQRYMMGRVPFPAIKGYSVQTVKELCPINAIIFHTKKGKTCTDPALNWVMDYVNRLRNKAQRVHINTAQGQK